MSWERKKLLTWNTSNFYHFKGFSFKQTNKETKYLDGESMTLISISY